MKRFSLIICITVLVVSCVSERQEQLPCECRIIKVCFDASSTKTGITGSTIHFETGDEIPVICEGVNTIPVTNSQTGDNTVFEGTYRALWLTRKDCDWYSVYPSSLNVSGNGVVSGTLPETQTAPFDPDANVMYSDIIVADYDETNQPNLRFWMNQAMGLIRIAFCNTDDAYADDILESVQLTSSVVMAGAFTMDIHSPVVSFAEGGDTHVSAVYQTEETLGVDQQHWVFLFVNPVQLSNATLIVRTDKHTFTYHSSKSVLPKAGTMTMLPLMDLADFSVDGHTYLKKRVVCWGDSFTSANYAEKTTYCKYLQALLGNDWEVLNGGISGNRTDEIAARQGGLPVVTGSAFTIPAETTTIQIDGVLKIHNILEVDGFYNIRRFGGALANPCKLIGTHGEEVLCEINSNRTENGSDTTYYATLSRLTAGSPVEIAEHTPIQTYAARKLRDVDLTIIYMGTNGSFGSNDENRRYIFSRWDNLIAQHWEMINYTEHPKDYIILGRHDGVIWDDYHFSDYMEPAFGKRYLNLRRAVVENESTIKHWLVYSGAYASESEIPQSVIDHSLEGYWPQEFYHARPGDSHPNEYAAKVIGKLVYDKMVELGYVN